MDSKEFDLWIKYAELEPFGEERADLRAGIIASTIANVNRTKKDKPFQASDFMPEFTKEPSKQPDNKLMKFQLEMFKNMHNAHIAKKGMS